MILIIVEKEWLGKDMKQLLYEPYKRLYERMIFLSREQTKNNKNIVLKDIDEYVEKRIRQPNNILLQGVMISSCESLATHNKQQTTKLIIF